MRTQAAIGTTRAVRYVPQSTSPRLRPRSRMPRAEFERFRTAAMHRIAGTRYDATGTTHVALPVPQDVTEGVEQGAELALNLLLAVREAMAEGTHTRIRELLAAVAEDAATTRAGFDRFNGFCDVLETALCNYVTAHDPIAWAQTDRFGAGARVAARMVEVMS